MISNKSSFLAVDFPFTIYQVRSNVNHVQNFIDT